MEQVMAPPKIERPKRSIATIVFGFTTGVSLMAQSLNFLLALFQVVYGVPAVSLKTQLLMLDIAMGTGAMLGIGTGVLLCLNGWEFINRKVEGILISVPACVALADLYVLKFSIGVDPSLASWVKVNGFLVGASGGIVLFYGLFYIWDRVVGKALRDAQNQNLSQQ